MSRASSFGVGLVTTTDFVPFAAASAASVRRYNSSVPITVYVDERCGDLERLAGALQITIEQVPTPARELWAATTAERQSMSSRLVKIQSLLRTRHDHHLYLDSDTLLLGDIGEIEVELADRIGSRADLFMLLHRPTAPTFWTDRHYYFRDPDLDRETVTRLVNETYDLSLPTSFMDELLCWNSGVIYGTAAALQLLASRWLTLYERMLSARTRKLIIPRDQLSFWITLWELRSTLRVMELPRRWNFMAGHLLGIAPGTAELDPAPLAGVRVLHLAQNKSDPWAVRRVNAALTGLDIPGVAEPV